MPISCLVSGKYQASSAVLVGAYEGHLVTGVFVVVKHNIREALCNGRSAIADSGVGTLYAACPLVETSDHFGRKGRQNDDSTTD